jgi:hypothetical protein
MLGLLPGFYFLGRRLQLESGQSRRSPEPLAKLRIELKWFKRQSGILKAVVEARKAPNRKIKK